MEDSCFNELKKLYLAYGHRLYIVGGTTRDLLLNRPFEDRDYATDATPEEEKAFLVDASYAYERFGAVRLSYLGREIDITTLRTEDDYSDFRHPGRVHFVKTPELDYVRRDFTVNALYLDEDYQLLDYCQGLDDLHRRVLRFIGDPEKRVQEDPLRIARAERFSRVLDFSIEEKSQAAIDKYSYLLAKVNPEKLKEEERKGWKK